MSFLNFQALWHLLWIFPLLALLYWRAKTKRSKFLSKALGSRADDPEYVQLSKGRRFLRFVIFLVAVFFLMLAAARPYWGMKIMPFTGKGRDLLIAFDVSKSMLSKDIQPSRLDHAKWFVRQLASDPYGDRYGLIAFAGSSFLECPLTSDKTSFFQVLDELEPDTIPLGGTNIQKALETSLLAFKAAESGHRAIILISDGDELTGNSAKVLAQLKAKKIPLFVVGVGDPAKPGLIPIRSKDGKVAFLRDSKGELVKSKLNEPQLSKLALDTNGIYVRSTAANAGLQEVLQRVQSLVPKDFGSGKRTKPIERFHFPLLISIILFLAWLSISERRSNGTKFKKAALLAGGIMLLSFGAANNASAQAPGLQQPPRKQFQGIPASGANLLPKKTQSQPITPEAPPAIDPKDANNPEALFNKGLELQKKKSKHASAFYEQAINLSGKNPNARGRSYQNIGVIIHNKARAELMKSIGLVKQQNLDGALKNIDVAMKEMSKAEEMYVQSMSLSSQLETNQDKSPAPKNKDKENKVEKVRPLNIAVNQQKLLNDQQMAERLKKMIEELKKKQKEAQKKTQKAKQEQKKSNQKKQDQKKQDQKKQDQKKSKPQDKVGPQEKADKARQEAQKAVDDFKEQAQKLKQKKMENAAKKAQQELKKAEEAQKKDQGKKAEEHLKKALDHLGNDKQDKKKQDKKKDKGKKGKDKKDKQDKQNKDKNDQKLPKPKQQKAQPQKAEKEKKIDKKQAEALLEIMANQEKSLRDAIKEKQKKHYKVRGVEKDW